MLRGELSTVLRLSAEQAFVGIGDTFLAKLLRHFALPSADTVMQKVESLVRRICPDLSEDKIIAILQKRAKAPKDAATLLDPEVRGLLSECLESTDFKSAAVEHQAMTDVKSTVKAVRQYLMGKGYVQDDVVKAVKAAPGIGSSSGSMHPAAAAAPAPVAKEASGYSGKGVAKKPAALDVVLARRLLPPTPGCVIQPYVARKSFQQYYSNNPEPPRSKVFHWSDSGPTETQALEACARWCWQQHTRLTGEECPHKWLWGDDAVKSECIR